MGSGSLWEALTSDLIRVVQRSSILAGWTGQLRYWMKLKGDKHLLHIWEMVLKQKKKKNPKHPCQCCIGYSKQSHPSVVVVCSIWDVNGEHHLQLWCVFKLKWWAVWAQPFIRMRCELVLFFSCRGGSQISHMAQGLPLWTKQAHTSCWWICRDSITGRCSSASVLVREATDGTCHLLLFGLE